jgi:hypothetical protein
VSKSVIQGAKPVNNQRHFETTGTTARREATVIQKILDDLARTIQLLNDDIAAEEDRTQVFDVFDGRYSMLARSLGARRDNMKVTVAALSERLRAVASKIPDSMQEAA